MKTEPHFARITLHTFALGEGGGGFGTDHETGEDVYIPPYIVEKHFPDASVVGGEYGVLLRRPANPDKHAIVVTILDERGAPLSEAMIERDGAEMNRLLHEATSKLQQAHDLLSGSIARHHARREAANEITGGGA